MTLVKTSPAEIDFIQQPQTHEQALALKQNVSWNRLKEITVGEALELWLKTLRPLTATNYRSGMNQLADRGYIAPGMSLQAFSLVTHEAIVDRIKKDNSAWSECTRQSRAACYISFTSFLSRRFGGLIKKAIPNKEGNAKTFFRVRDKVKSQAMTFAQWNTFLGALETINERDCMIAKIILQGGKRVNEVLSLTVSQIDWEKCEITFKQSKTKGAEKETIITYPQSIMEALRQHTVNAGALVFSTKTGRKITVGQLAKTFEKAGNIAQIPFRVTPHVLRASTITYLKQQGYDDSDVMKVSGHACSAMVYAYDKSSRADNASKKVNLVR